MSDWFRGLKCGEILASRLSAEDLERYQHDYAVRFAQRRPDCTEFLEGVLDYLEYRRVNLLGELHGKD